MGTGSGFGKTILIGYQFVLRGVPAESGVEGFRAHIC